MFWISLFGLAIATALYRLGSLSVWVAVQSATLKVVAAAGLLLVAYAVWRLAMMSWPRAQSISQ